jgi:Ca-activated chloride channel family protein
VPTVLYLGAIAALAVALARPSAVVTVPRDESTVMLTMDVSASMRAEDVTPDRLSAAKASANAFIDQLPAGFRIGVVAFSSEARLVLDPTTDRAAAHRAIDSLRAQGGTALGDAIVLSLQATADARTASVSGGETGPSSTDPAAPTASPATGEAPLVATVLLSDGANSSGATEPLDAASQAAAAGMPVYTIALGTQDGTVTVPDQTGAMRTLQVPPDTQTLASIAQTTGGRFFQAPTAEDLAQIYESLGSRVGTTQQEQEITQWFAAAALVLVVGGAGLAALWFNRFP